MNYASRSYTAPSLRTSPERGAARNSDQFHRFAALLPHQPDRKRKRDPIDFLSVL